MAYPPRLSHLATRPVVVAKLAPTYSRAHHIDEEEGVQRLTQALQGRLLPRLLEEAWTSLLGKTKRLDEDGLLEKVATTLRDRPQRPGRTVEVTPGWSAFLVLADLEAGTASEAARRVMESDAGRERAQAGVAEVGRFLAAELTRGR